MPSSRWSELDTDLERLPEGMVRIGYDSDTQTYTFRDSDGSIWEGAPGCEFGLMRRVSFGGYGAALGPSSDATPFLSASDAEAQIRRKERLANQKVSWRAEMMPLLNFFVLLAVSMLVFMYFLSRPSRVDTSSEEVALAGAAVHEEKVCPGGTTPYEIVAGDTCWAIAQAHAIDMEALSRANEGMECDTLAIGEKICVSDP
jgi:hypothetical protein